MSDDLTLPGDLPGLLRQSSPVVGPDGTTGAVLDMTDGEVSVGWTDWSMKRGPLDKLGLRLNLTDPTGRIHAAWWASARVVGDLTPTQAALLWKALAGADMDRANDIATLRDFCLRLAGRTP